MCLLSGPDCQLLIFVYLDIWIFQLWIFHSVKYQGKTKWVHAFSFWFWSPALDNWIFQLWIFRSSDICLLGSLDIWIFGCLDFSALDISLSQISREAKMRARLFFLVLIASFWFLFMWIFGYFSKMRRRLFFLILIASFGYFTLGLALAWPASALPSIRFVLVPFLDQTVTFTWIFNSVPFYSILPSFHTTLFW